VTSSLAVFEAAIWIKSKHDKIMFKNQKKRKYENKKSFYINL